MSGNQKQAPPVGGGQTQTRFPQQQPYLPRPPTPRAEFHVGHQPYVQQQQQPPNQIANQGPPLRGMAPTGPPTQASTPPNADLKVQQHVQQPQPTMGMYQSRGAPNFFSRPPNSQTPRILNPRPNQQAIYTGHPSIPMQPFQVLNVPAMPQFQGYGQRAAPAAFMQPNVGYYQGHTYMATPQYAAPYYNYQALPRQPQAQVQQVPQGMQHAPPQAPTMAPTVMAAAQQPKKPTKKRTNAIQIINPETMLPIDDEEMHPTSGESSARQTPQPAPLNSKEVQATFAKQVAQAINKDSASAFAAADDDQHPQPLSQHHEAAPHQHQLDAATAAAAAAAAAAQQPSPPAQQTQPPAPFHQISQNVHNRNEIAKSSKLQVPTNDFVPANNQSNTAKETPVVSAISNAAEVTIPGKPKERESPAKGRKPREQPQPPAAAAGPKEPPSLQHKEPASGKEAAAAPLPPQAKEVVATPVVESVKPKEETKPKELATAAQAPTEPLPKPAAKEVQSQQHPQPPQPALAQRDEKKQPAAAAPPPPKKDNVVPAENANAAPSQQAPPAVSQESSGKSKQTQRGKDQSKQAGGQQTPGANSKPAAAANPQPPAKSNKANKMKELNLKGANKEGTDMDAFSIGADVAPANANDVPAPVVAQQPTQQTPAVTQPPPVAQPPPAVQAPVPVAAAPVVVAEKEAAETNSEPPPPPVVAKPDPPKKSSFDITAIVRDQPKPFTAPPPAVQENRDETDRAPLSNDKLVQAKNEANAKTAISNDQPDIKPLQYKDDQWSPQNPKGKKSYDRDFLMALRSYPNSKTKPENIISDVLAGEDRNRVGDIGRYSVGGRPDFAPSFGGGNAISKSQSTRIPPKRNSQQGKPSGNSKGGKSGSMIRVSISFREDVKLHEAENAWKPARLNPSVVKTDDDRKTEDLYKKVRGVLNKLTPQKFSTLLNQIKTLPIDTTERLQGVIDLVFEKAVDEPNFSVAYALMCRELALMQVLVSPDSKEFVNFRKLLVTRCQIEFEKNSSEESNRNARLVEIEACTDPEKKKEMMANLDEDDRRIRMKSVGNIRFIGELFKQQMLTQNIMVRCLYNLIENEDEERLECLCKLLSTIGKDLEAKSVDLSKIFDQMRNIVDRKNGKVSSRVRFMLQDVIDLRFGGWVPRRTDLNPKTIEQIQKEAEHEQMTIAAMNSGPMTPRKDDRNASNSGKRGGRAMDDSGWVTAGSRKTNQSFMLQADKLKIQNPPIDEPLGSRSSFSNWSRGSSVSQKAAPTGNSSSNKFALLESANDMDSRGGYRKDPYMSKGTSLERTFKSYDGRNSRSGSQHRGQEREREKERDRDRDSSQRNTPTPTQQAQPQPKAPQQFEQLSADKLMRISKGILEEFMNDLSSLDDTIAEIKEKFHPSQHHEFVSAMFNEWLERSVTAREKVGVLCSHLLKRQIISLESYCIALKEMFASAEDLLVDIPKIWTYLADLTATPINTGTLSLRALHKCADCLLKQRYAPHLLAAVLNTLIKMEGPVQLKAKWDASNLTFADWMEPKLVDNFVETNSLTYLTGTGGNPAAGQCNLTYKDISEKLIHFFKSEASNDDVFTWISANVCEKEKENEFIRVLSTAYINHAMANDKFQENIFLSNQNVLVRYIESNTTFQLHCLYAVQAIVNKLGHPSGLLLKIFNALYEHNVISYEAFLMWESSEDPLGQESKGVAVKQLTSFFTQLKEGESENESASSTED